MPSWNRLMSLTTDKLSKAIGSSKCLSFNCIKGLRELAKVELSTASGVGMEIERIHFCVLCIYLSSRRVRWR